MTYIQSNLHVDDIRLKLRVRRARKDTARILRRLRRAVEARDEHRVRGLIALVLNFYACKLAAIDEANRARPVWRRLPLADLFYRADRLDAWRGSREPVRMGVEPKKSSGTRLVMSFGIENRALQIMVRWVLHPWVRARLLPQQHVLRGGRTRAVIATKSMIEEGGHRYAVELDIQNMYGSINVAWLKENLPIPPAVVEAVCTAQHMNVIPVGHISIMHMQGSRLGIPQGSAVSPLLSEFVVASMLAGLPAEMPFQTYVDNIACSARNEEEMRSRQEIVARCIEAHPAGSFKVRSLGIVRTGKGFSYLGYELTKRRYVQVSVSDAKQAAWRSTLSWRWEHEWPVDYGRRFVHAYLFIQSLRASSSLWCRAREMERAMLVHILHMIPYQIRRELGLAVFTPDGYYPWE